MTILVIAASGAVQARQFVEASRRGGHCDLALKVQLVPAFQSAIILN